MRYFISCCPQTNSHLRKGCLLLFFVSIKAVECKYYHWQCFTNVSIIENILILIKWYRHVIWMRKYKLSFSLYLSILLMVGRWRSAFISYLGTFGAKKNNTKRLVKFRPLYNLRMQGQTGQQKVVDRSFIFEQRIYIFI